MTAAVVLPLSSRLKRRPNAPGLISDPVNGYYWDDPEFSAAADRSIRTPASLGGEAQHNNGWDSRFHSRKKTDSHGFQDSRR